MDRFDIKAQVHRSGSTLSAIAKAAGLDGSSGRRALIYPIPRANAAIATHLNTTVHALWPDWFDEEGNVRPGVRSRTWSAAGTSRKRKAA